VPQLASFKPGNLKTSLGFLVTSEPMGVRATALRVSTAHLNVPD